MVADAASSAPNYAFTGVAQIRMVGSYVVNGQSSKPPFEYVDAANTSVPMSSGCGCLVDADRLKVRAVGVRFSVRHSTSLKVAPTTLETRVRLPNVDYNQLTPGP
jgi:hypothetical protein